MAKMLARRSALPVNHQPAQEDTHGSDSENATTTSDTFWSSHPPAQPLGEESSAEALATLMAPLLPLPLADQAAALDHLTSYRTVALLPPAVAAAAAGQSVAAAVPRDDADCASGPLGAAAAACDFGGGLGSGIDGDGDGGPRKWEAHESLLRQVESEVLAARAAGVAPPGCRPGHADEGRACGQQQQQQEWGHETLAAAADKDVPEASSSDAPEASFSGAQCKHAPTRPCDRLTSQYAYE